LLNGAKSIQQSAEMNKLLQIYMIALVDEKVSDLALRLFQKYSIRNKLKISDTFIAATALRNDLFIYTDNKSDFDFFVGIKFYLEKEF
jgi:predicted nucleic acid-binding protein